jgi:hypothetical protein
MKLIVTVLAAVFAVVSLSANADLAAVGPVNPFNGFPIYYEDSNHLMLDLCIPVNADELNNGSCLLFPEDIPDDSKPIALTETVKNFPDEAFWYNASAKTGFKSGVPDPSGKGATLVMAVEAAFANVVKLGDQIAFSRVRYKFWAPYTGNYTIETPYTVDSPVHYGAGELVFETVDIGVACAQGDFSCAMKGLTAPFLWAAESEGGKTKDFVPLFGHTYLADPAVETFVTGGPKGNRFRITVVPDGTAAAIEVVNTNHFSLMGRVSDGSMPIPPVFEVALPAVPAAPKLATVKKPKVSISAVDPLASEASGDSGKFMVNLNAPSAKNIKVKLSIDGNATKGRDYQRCSSSLYIPAGSVFGTIDVYPVNDNKHEGVEKVKIKLSGKGSKDYSVGKGSAIVKILDDD